VTIDGKPAGVGKQGPYKTGRHSVRAQASGYTAAEQEIMVDNGEIAIVSLSLAVLPGKLLISVNVAARCGAGEVQLDAKPDGVVKLEVPPGNARVTCSAEGHEDASSDVTIGTGHAQAVTLTLKRRLAIVPKAEAPLNSEVTLIALPGGTLQLKDGNFNGTRVAPFKLARTATTVAQYTKCVDAGGCSEPKTGANCNWGPDRSDHPVNCVDWYQATGFCRWMGGRLPTAQEREWAASSGEGSDMGKGNRKTTCVAGSHPAGASKQGVQDLAGNVWEWLSTDYSGGKEFRGGSWGDDDAGDLRARYTGTFRPVRSTSPASVVAYSF
jgi:formylglycine-generating enzyme required for sulfatase activity